MDIVIAFTVGIAIASIYWLAAGKRAAEKAAKDAMAIGYSVAVDHLSRGVINDVVYLEGKYRNPSER